MSDEKPQAGTENPEGGAGDSPRIEWADSPFVIGVDAAGPDSADALVFGMRADAAGRVEVCGPLGDFSPVTPEWIEAATRRWAARRPAGLTVMPRGRSVFESLREPDWRTRLQVARHLWRLVRWRNFERARVEFRPADLWAGLYGPVHKERRVHLYLGLFLPWVLHLYFFEKDARDG